MGLNSDVHADTLAQLGTERLAELLVEEAARNPNLERRLESLLAYHAGPQARARYMRDRLNRWSKPGSSLSGRRPRELARELAHDRRTIVEGIAPEAPETAFQMMLAFLDLHQALLDAIDDPDGHAIDVFDAACADLGTLAERADVDPARLCDAACRRLTDDPHGLYDGLITALQPALGEEGLRRIEAELRGRFDGQGAEGRGADRGQGGRDAVADTGTADATRAVLAARLREVADLRGDVDTYIATLDAADLLNPKMAAAAAVRLTAAGRAEQAIAYLDAAPPTSANGHFGELDWATARVSALEAAGYPGEAQDIRLGSFPSTPSAAHLKAYLTRLVDSFDGGIDQEALDFVETRPTVHNALAFLISWLAHQHPARLVLARHPEQRHEHAQLLLPAAAALEGEHPLASIVLRRALIEDALVWSRPERYPDAVRQVRNLDRLDGEIDSYEAFETHDQFLHRLRREHAQKYRFWSLLTQAGGASADWAARGAHAAGDPRDRASAGEAHDNDGDSDGDNGDGDGDGAPATPPDPSSARVGGKGVRDSTPGFGRTFMRG